MSFPFMYLLYLIYYYIHTLITRVYFCVANNLLQFDYKPDHSVILYDIELHNYDERSGATFS